MPWHSPFEHVILSPPILKVVILNIALPHLITAIFNIIIRWPLSHKQFQHNISVKIHKLKYIFLTQVWS